MCPLPAEKDQKMEQMHLFSEKGERWVEGWLPELTNPDKKKLDWCMGHLHNLRYISNVEHSSLQEKDD